MYRNLLVPVAFDTDNAPEAALAIAGRLAGPGARVTLLHVMEEAPPYALTYIPADVTEALKDSLRDEMGRMAAAFEDGHAVLAEGHAGRTILHWAQDNGVDCIVIPSRQPGIEDRLFLGSTAGWVVTRAPCAVHVVR